MEETSLAIYFIWIQAKSELIMLIMLIKQIANYQLSTINTYRKRNAFSSKSSAESRATAWEVKEGI